MATSEHLSVVWIFLKLLAPVRRKLQCAIFQPTIFRINSNALIKIGIKFAKIPNVLNCFSLLLQIFEICSYKYFFTVSGNTGFIESEHNALTAVLEDCLEPDPTTCNKETGGKQRLQKWSRGHLFIVRGGGIIDKWNPLFKWVIFWNLESYVIIL